jgi:hypothetical protein
MIWNFRNLTPSIIKDFRHWHSDRSKFHKEIKKIESIYNNYRNIEYFETTLLNDFSKRFKTEKLAKPIFIIASPRTGSTLLYQLICKYLKVYYFTNFVDDLLDTPLFASLISSNLIELERRNIKCLNNYGVAHGIAGPNESTKLFSNWFNHTHPSEIHSSKFISNKAKFEMKKKFSIIEKFSNMRILTKNAWNCFRIEELSKTFPDAHFIYLKRNIVDSSYSTLLARKKCGDPNIVWDSASPKEYKEIKKLAPHMQVVEQQKYTNMAVLSSLKKIKNITHVKYEDLVSNPKSELIKIKQSCELEETQSNENVVSEINTFQDLKKTRCDSFINIVEYCKKRNYI